MGIISGLIGTSLLEQVGCTNIEKYTLVSNHGFTFSKGGVKYDLRYWENCYGVYGGGWSVHSTERHVKCPSFDDDFFVVVEWIKENL